jgi:hypothetical protein
VKQNATFDSSFWINAHRSGLLPYVLTAYALRYPPAVARELRIGFPSGSEFWRLVASGALEPIAPEREHLRDFGPGEREAIAVAAEHPEWLLFLDDVRPLQRAIGLGLRAVCSPLLTVALYVEGQIGDIDALQILHQLTRIQTVSPSLLAPALNQLAAAMRERGERERADT